MLLSCSLFSHRRQPVGKRRHRWDSTDCGKCQGGNKRGVTVTVTGKGVGVVVFFSDTGTLQMPQPFTEMEEEHPRQRE